MSRPAKPPPEASPKSPALTPELVVRAYCLGYFPMARSRRARSVDWYSPDLRAVLPLDGFHVPHGLRRRLKKPGLLITGDRDFPAVIRACAKPRDYQKETWINRQVIDVYTQLHRKGLAHSVEAWQGDGQEKLVGGLYGLALGGAFFGESMFSLVPDASKLCLVSLVERLRQGGFTLLDVQLSSPHMAQFGVVEVPRDRYLQMLQQALRRDAEWR